MKYIALILFLASCHPKAECDHRGIAVRNNSSSTMYVLYFFHSQEPADTTFPKSFKFDPRSLGYTDKSDSEFYKIPPHSENVNAISDNRPSNCFSWQFYGELNQSIEVFLIDSVDIRALSWDTVKKYNVIKARYFLSGADLDKLGWVVTYP